MIIGWYVIGPANEQVAWHKTRAGARRLAAQYSKRLGVVCYTHPEYA